jgi:hypothetical protein
MAEIDEAVQEQVEHAAKNKLNSMVAVMVAVTATFMALCNVKDGNIVQAMSQAQANSLNSWNYFEAKSTKQAIAENALTTLKLQTPPASSEVIKNFEATIARYEKEKEVIKAQAEAYEKQYNDINLFDDQFDMTDALLTISIAMLGVASLTQKRWLFYFASAVSCTGILLGLAAFMKISLHSDFVSKILG